MSKFTDRERRFLEALGITPGPWKKSYMPGNESSIIWDSDDLMFPLADVRKRENVSNLGIIEQSPAIFLALFQKTLDEDEPCRFDHHGYCQTHSCFGEPGWCDVKDNKELCEVTTGKSWAKLCEIWESLNEL